MSQEMASNAAGLGLIKTPQKDYVTLTAFWFWTTAFGHVPWISEPFFSPKSCD